jgi:hypothetical protein
MWFTSSPRCRRTLISKSLDIDPASPQRLVCASGIDDLVFQLQTGSWMEIPIMMLLKKWFRLVNPTALAPRKARRDPLPRRQRFRPMVELLEERMTPSAYSWTGANFAMDLNWNDPANWSGGSGGVPGASDSASFSGTTTPVCNITSAVTVGALTVTNTYTQAITVKAPLTVTGDLILDFHPSTGTFGGDGAITVDGTGSRWSGGVLDIGAGGFANNGTLTIDTGTSSGLEVFGTGTLTNNGTINEMGSAGLLLAEFNSLTLNNTGLYDFVSDCGINGDGSNTVINAATGTIAKTGGSGTSGMTPGTFQNLGGTLQATSGTLGWGGGSTAALVDGATLQTGSGGTLQLTTSPVTYEGTVIGSGSGKILLDNSSLVVGSSGVTFDMTGSTLFQWLDGAAIDVSSGGTFTNASGSTLNMNTDLAVASLTGAGKLTNNGVINESGGSNFELFNGATLSNQKTFNLNSDAGISSSGGGTVVNAGTLRKAAGTGTSTISCLLNNTGTLLVSSGTVHVSGSVTQISGGVLNAGKWTVSVGGTKHGTLSIDTGFTTIGAHAAVTLNGANAVFTDLNSLAVILSGGSLVLQGNASLSTPSSLTNSGKLTIGPGSTLTANGSFTDSSTASLAIQLGGTNGSPKFGQVVSTSGTVTLGGTLQVTSTVVPSVGSSFEILSNEGGSPISGTFSRLAEGATFTVRSGSTTMTFQITYVGDGGNNVVITRIS